MLPGMNKFSQNNQKMQSKKYINNIYKTKAYQLHKNFFKNYMTMGYPVILSHIKHAYEKYVLSGKWSEDKFNLILYVLISHEKKLTNNAFNNMSIEYDNGTIKYEKAYADFNNKELDNKNLSSDDNELYNFLNNQ